jgi:hypothetical protein
VERLNGHQTPQGFKAKMAILACVEGQDEGREINENADPFSPNETTPWLQAVGAEAVKRDNKAQNMKSVAEMIAEPRPNTGRKELLPMQT